ncbi:S24 family peptidase [Oricola sp.]|uniref:S24 family peptidase n=1 Tax=Oricola sp. TaxID=1979950 RepID=UPI0025CEC1B6|nr:S24 family peptidase [Oricola sp.]MCI5075589.1 helix-turn-helix transcriptional regulator [Oricola sp.]
MTVGRNEVAIARYSVQASAGNGAVVLAEEVADWFRVGRDWLERYVPRGARTGVIEARGDSMEPTISDGDILLLNFDVNRQDVANGGVFVITIDGNLFVKRLQIMLDGSIMIRSDNDRYEPERVDREYADEKMLVHARVVWSGGPLR